MVDGRGLGCSGTGWVCSKPAAEVAGACGGAGVAESCVVARVGAAWAPAGKAEVDFWETLGIVEIAIGVSNLMSLRCFTKSS